MGNLFGVILMSFTLIVLLISLWLLRYILDGRKLLVGRMVLLLFNGLIAWHIMRNDHWLHSVTPMTGYLVQTIIILFMLQILTCCLVGIAVLVRLAWRKMLNAPVDKKRRRLLKKAAVYPLAAGGMSIYGGLYESSHTVDRNHTLNLPTLSELSGYKIAQLSDIHLGLFFKVEHLAALLERVAEAKPDILVITGDLFDDVSQNAAAAKLLDSYVERFNDGIWYCIGNHEYYRGGIAMIKKLLAETSVHALYNQAEKIPGCDLWLAGVEYSFAKDKTVAAQERAAFLAKAMQTPIPEKSILLAHHPDFIDNAAEYNIPLTLTGHTHGSQFGILGIPLFPVFKYTRGFVKINNSYGYVHCGNGSWFPFRFGCPPEIAYFTIE